MDFDTFAPARDLVYLSFFFLGAGTGCILNRYRRQSSGVFRNISITAAFCFYSVAVAMLTAASVISNWQIFGESRLYLPLVILAAVISLAVRFPRTLGFALVLASGIFAIWIGYVSVGFPAIDGRAAIGLGVEKNGLIRARLNVLSGKEPDISFSIQPSTEFLVFHTVFGSFPANFPLVGGINRGLISEIRGKSPEGEGIFYKNTRLNVLSAISPGAGNSGLSGQMRRFFSIQEAAVPLDTKSIFPGAVMTLFITGK